MENKSIAEIRESLVNKEDRGRVVTYNMGDGLITLEDTTGEETVVFGEGIDHKEFSYQVKVLEGKVYLDIAVNANGDMISILCSNDCKPPQTFEFANGIILDPENMKERYKSLDLIWGTDGDDTISGFANADKDNFIFAGAGNDTVVSGLDEDVVYGGAGNDKLYGNGDDDTLYGEEGDDRLYGGDGYDVLYGGDGDDAMYGENDDDILYGGTGNDRMRGGEGKNILYGEDGNDLLVASQLGLSDSAYNDQDELHGGAGNDKYYLEQGFGRVLLFDEKDINDPNEIDTLDLSGMEFDKIEVSQSEEDLTLHLYNWDKRLHETVVIKGFNSEKGSSINRFKFSDGTVCDAEYLLNRVQKGTDDDDYIKGYDNEAVGDSISGLKGNDRIKGYKGNDYLYGDDGDDFLDGGEGNDYLEGGNGNDSIVGGDGKDTLYGSEGNDKLYGGNGDDILSDYQGDNEMHGGAGNDSLVGGYGNDTLYGGEGNDTINVGLLDKSSERNLVSGGKGDDTIYLGKSSKYVSTDTVLYNLGDGNDVIQYSSSEDVLKLGKGISISDIEFGYGVQSLYLGYITLTFKQTGETIRLDSLSGQESLRIEFEDGTILSSEEIAKLSGKVLGTEADDVLDFSKETEGIIGDSSCGNDYFKGGTGINQFDGGRGDDELHGNVSADWLMGWTGDDKIYGYEGNDCLEGDAGNDYLDGGVGDDVLIEKDGNNTLIGGAGRDRFILKGGSNKVYGGEGYDQIEISEGSTASVFFNRGDGHDWITGQAEGIYFGEGITKEDIVFGEYKKLCLKDSPEDSISISKYTKLVFADGSEISEEEVHLLFNTHVGTEGDDWISGTYSEAYETFDGKGGNDKLYGGDGSDTYFINKGTGTDSVKEYEFYEGLDRIVFGEGLKVENAVVTYAESDPWDKFIDISFTDTDEKVRIAETSSKKCAIEELEFADGTIWTAADVEAMIQTQKLAQSMAVMDAAVGASLMENSEKHTVSSLELLAPC